VAAEPAFQRFPNDDQLLVRATELVERGWSRSALAEDRDGRQVEPWSESAIRWSPLGALISAWYEGGGGRVDEFDTAVRALALATGGRPAEWNAVPWRTKWHVLSAFERARQYLPEARADRPA
jgi:hypothetical protein